MITTAILTSNPFAKKVIMNWFMEKMIESFKDQSVPQEMVDYMRENGISDERLIDALNINPRMLFDVLDENDVLVQININFDNKSFSYNINGDVISGGFNNRKDCEMHAIVEAIVYLNKKLAPEEAEIVNEENLENQ